jgi:hypothetical protein
MYASSSSFFFLDIHKKVHEYLSFMHSASLSTPSILQIWEKQITVSPLASDIYNTSHTPAANLTAIRPDRLFRLVYQPPFQFCRHCVLG